MCPHVGGDLCQSLHWEYVNGCVIEDIGVWESGGKRYFTTVREDLNALCKGNGTALKCGGEGKRIQ